MRKYDYNIRCKMCKKGFTPELKETASRKLCPKCLKISDNFLRKQKLEISSA